MFSNKHIRICLYDSLDQTSLQAGIPCHDASIYVPPRQLPPFRCKDQESSPGRHGLGTCETCQQYIVNVEPNLSYRADSDRFLSSTGSLAYANFLIMYHGCSKRVSMFSSARPAVSGTMMKA